MTVNYKEANRELKNQLINKVNNNELNTFITLNPNTNCSLEKLKFVVGEFNKMVKGRIFQSEAFISQYGGYGFIEYGNNLETPHIHALVFVPEKRLEYFHRKAGKIWKACHKQGSFNVQHIDASTSERIVDYVFKEADKEFYVRHGNPLDNIIPF